MLQPFCNTPNSCVPRAFTQTTSLQQTEPSAVHSLKNFNSPGDKDTHLITSHCAPAILTSACSFQPWLNSKLFNRGLSHSFLYSQHVDGGRNRGRERGREERRFFVASNSSYFYPHLTKPQI